LAAGKPALVEKPVALGLAETLALEREVSASGVPVLVDHTMLYHPGFEALRARCPDPRAIRFVHSESRAWGPFRAEKVPVLWDRGPHDVAMCLELFGARPIAVAGLAAWPGTPPALDAQMMTLRLDFAGGASAWIEIGHLASERRGRFSVFCDRAALVFDDGPPSSLAERSTPWRFAPGDSEGAARAIEVADERPLSRVVREFAAGVGGRPSPRFGLGLAAQ